MKKPCINTFLKKMNYFARNSNKSPNKHDEKFHFVEKIHDV